MIMISDICLIFIAVINVVKQVPKFAPIMIPKHSFGLIRFAESNEIEIAVTPDDDWIIAAVMQPNKKLLVLEFVTLFKIWFILCENKLFKCFLIKSKDNKKMQRPDKINIKVLIIQYMNENNSYA